MVETKTATIRPATEFLEVASISRGWVTKELNGTWVLATEFGGNEIRFQVSGGGSLVLHVVTEPYVFMHVYVNGEHHQVIGPEQKIAVKIRAVNTTEVRIVRTAVSSGPFYVDGIITGYQLEGGARIGRTVVPVPGTVFCTFGDSISGNCCIGPDGPYDPHGLGYGYSICDRFEWQYYNTARDGSAVCCTPFDNPLAADRVQKEVIDARPDYLLVFYGTNDIRHGDISPEKFAADYRALMRTLVDGLPSARIALSGLLWNDVRSKEQIEEYNRVIAGIAAELGVPCTQPYSLLTPRDDFDDGAHPSAEGQDKLAKAFGDFFVGQWPELNN